MSSKYNPESWKELRETERIEKQKMEEALAEIRKHRNQHVS